MRRLAFQIHLKEGSFLKCHSFFYFFLSPLVQKMQFLYLAPISAICGGLFYFFTHLPQSYGPHDVGSARKELRVLTQLMRAKLDNPRDRDLAQELRLWHLTSDEWKFLVVRADGRTTKQRPLRWDDGE
jgi:hypothetical protein